MAITVSDLRMVDPHLEGKWRDNITWRSELRVAMCGEQQLYNGVSFALYHVQFL